MGEHSVQTRERIKVLSDTKQPSGYHDLCEYPELERCYLRHENFQPRHLMYHITIGKENWKLGVQDILHIK